MSIRLSVSPRTAVTAAFTTLVALAATLMVRTIGAREGASAPSPPRPLAAASAALVPEPKTIRIDELAIPCWSCPNAEAWPLRFQTDLDIIAPLGTGAANAAEWLAAYSKPGGSRAPTVDAVMKRRVDHPKLGRVLPPDDPFLSEAQPWMDQATMHFFPDIYRVEGPNTRVPNVMLALTLARSWVARGQAAARSEDALADFRRVVRLGRLLRQDNVLVIQDLVGLAIIRIGTEAIYDRARGEGHMDLALVAAVAAGEAPAQRLLSAARMTNAEVVPYIHRDAGASSIVISSERLEGLRNIALECPDRRFRIMSCTSLALVASFGTGESGKKAKATLASLANSGDALVASAASWYLANPIDQKDLDQILAQGE